jgi:Immunity protein 21
MKWLETTGGPFILMPKTSVPSWHGCAEGQSDVSDYSRACAIDDWIGVIPVVEQDALVLGDEPSPVTWLQHEDGGILIRWVGADSETDLIRLAQEAIAQRKPDAVMALKVCTANWLMIDSSCPGDMLEDSIPIVLPVGICRVSSIYVETEQTMVIVNEIRRASTCLHKDGDTGVESSCRV